MGLSVSASVIINDLIQFHQLPNFKAMDSSPTPSTIANGVKAGSFIFLKLK